MIQLVNVNIEEFKRVVFPQYIKLFPKEERKSYEEIEKSFNKNITKIIEIVDNDIFIGFMMINTIKDNTYIQLDYFAILPRYQNKGYGTQALNLLKKQSREFNGILVEIEKLGLGINETENKLREKRMKFYKRIGFYKLNFELEWFKNLIFVPYILQTSSYKDEEEEILKNIFEICIATHGKDKVEKNCKVLYRYKK